MEISHSNKVYRFFFLYLNKHPQILSVITKRKKKRIFNLEPKEIS